MAGGTVKRRGGYDFNGFEAKRARMWLMSGQLASTEEGMYGWNQVAKRAEIYDGSQRRQFAFLSDLAGISGGDAETLDGEDGDFYLDRANHTGSQLASTISNLATVVKAYRLDEFASPTLPLDLNGQRIEDLANGTGANHATTKGQVEALIANFVTSSDLVALRNQILGGVAPEYDTLIELLQEIQNNDSDIGDLLNLIQLRPLYYTTTFGDGNATQFVIQHDLHTRNVIHEVRLTGSPYDAQDCDIEYTTEDTCTVYAAPVPAQDELTLTLIGKQDDA